MVGDGTGRLPEWSAVFRCGLAVGGGVKALGELFADSPIRSERRRGTRLPGGP